MRRSTGEYPADWPQIAAQVKADAGGKCVRCGHVHDVGNGFMLTVHHLDMNKSHCVWYNLAALCQRCHLSIQGRVIMERTWMLPHTPWFRPYVAGFYAAQYGRPTTKEYVLAHLDELIALGQNQEMVTNE